jgi:DNA (cytosine-5)-methyltransferase 1
MAHGQANAEVGEGRSPTLSCNHEAPILAHQVVGPLCAQHGHAPQQGAYVGHIVPHEVVGPLCANAGGHGHTGGGQQAAYSGHIVTHPLTARHDSSPDGTGRGVPIVPVAFDSKRNPNPGEVSPALRAMGHDASHANAGGQVAVAYQCHGGNVGPMGTLRTGSGNVTSGVPFTFQPRVGRSGRGMPSDVVPALAGGSAGTGATSDMRPCVVARYAVRRLTPRECERLQGFPDDYTLVPFRGKPAKDGPRYRALGNSMAVPVMAWIGRRIEMCESVLTSREVPA